LILGLVGVQAKRAKWLILFINITIRISIAHAAHFAAAKSGKLL
jgi:hypothetical protein